MIKRIFEDLFLCVSSQVMVDKEVLSNCLANSHDIHMVTIDAREDNLTTRIKAWHEEVCQSLQR